MNWWEKIMLGVFFFNVTVAGVIYQEKTGGFDMGALCSAAPIMAPSSKAGNE